MLGVGKGAGAGLAWVAMTGAETTPPEAPLPDDPAARYIAERGAGIDAMAAEGTIDAARAKLIKARAEARCRSQAGGN